MACMFTREDLQEEFRKFSVEIRNLHQSLQQELNSDLNRLLNERSWCGTPLAPSTPLATSWLSSADLRRQRNSTPAARRMSSKEHDAGSVAFSFGDSVSTDGAWRPTSSFSRETKTAPSMVSEGSNDGSSQVHPAPAESSLRGAAVSGFYVQDALQLPSAIPEGGPGGKVLSEVPESILRTGSAAKKSDKKIEFSDARVDDEQDSHEQDRPEAHDFSPTETLATSIGDAHSWLPGTYGRQNSGKLSHRDSKNSNETANSGWSSYSDKAREIQKRVSLRRQDTDLTEFSHHRTTIYMVYKGEMTKSEAIYLFFRTEAFDYFMGIFLFANAISIGLQVEIMCGLRDDGSAEVPIWLRIVDFCFCMIFLTELLIRMCVWRSDYLRMPGWQWNCFDILVVGFSVIDEISKQFLVGTAMQATIDSMGVLRMLRLARVVRLIRMVRLIPELKSMVYLILSSMWSFFWTLVLLTLLIYVVSVYYTEVTTDLILKSDDSGSDSEAASGSSCDANDPTKNIDVELLKVHYGSIFSSFLSLFMAITGGDDWRNFVDLFKPEGSYLLNVGVFVIYISFVTLVMLNLVTGVFVEGAQRIVQSDKEAEITKNVRKLFHITDADGSGEISWEEFEAQLETKRMKHYLDAVDMNPAQAKGLFKLLDTDRSGELSVDEFVEGCLRLRVPARSVDLQTLKYDFEEITEHWARQFARIGEQITNIADMVERLSWATVASLPEELILV